MAKRHTIPFHFLLKLHGERNLKENFNWIENTNEVESLITRQRTELRCKDPMIVVGFIVFTSRGRDSPRQSEFYSM